MPFRQIRDRVVVFRLTADEHDLLQQACDDQRGRNLSDFARTELLKAITTQQGEHGTPAQIADLETRIAELETRLNHSAQMDRARQSPRDADG